MQPDSLPVNDATSRLIEGLRTALHRKESSIRFVVKNILALSRELSQEIDAEMADGTRDNRGRLVEGPKRPILPPSDEEDISW